MTALGKVLAVFVFLGSLAWLGLTVALFSTRADWKKAALDAEKAAQDTQAKAEALSKQVLEERRQTDARVASAEQSLQAVRKERDSYRTEYDKLKQTADRVAAKTEELQPLLDNYQAANDTLQKTADTLTKENQKISTARELAVLEQQKANDRANDITLQYNVTKKALDDQIEKTRALAEASKGGAAAPDADFRGDVLEVDADKGIVVFSGGANAGVKVGRRYVLQRATAPYYVGTVVVLDASDPRFSSGVFSPAAGQKLKGEYIPMKGDSVSAK